MKKLSPYKDSEPYITLDGSIIRELMHPDIHGNKQQSLAEATVNIGETTALHRHIKSEELYYILQGEGIVRLNNETLNVKQGDSICISPGTRHNIENTGCIDLKILCCCSPAYSHNDTELL